MRKVKVALDCDISHRIVGALESLYADRGFEFVAVDKLVPAASTDDHWAAAFKRFGGEVTLSADTQIAVKPHKVLSFIDNGFQSFFLQSPLVAQPGARQGGPRHLLVADRGAEDCRGPEGPMLASAVRRVEGLRAAPEGLRTRGAENPS